MFIHITQVENHLGRRAWRPLPVPCLTIRTGPRILLLSRIRERHKRWIRRTWPIWREARLRPGIKIDHFRQIPRVSSLRGNSSRVRRPIWISFDRWYGTRRLTFAFRIKCKTRSELWTGIFRAVSLTVPLRRIIQCRTCTAHTIEPRGGRRSRRWLRWVRYRVAILIYTL